MSGVPLRILVCGGRDFADKSLLYRTLDALVNVSDDQMLGDHCVIIHGACPTGADAIADAWATFSWKTVEQYPADWNAHGRAAGPLRNARMIAEGRPHLVIAFPGGRGTADMVRKARAAGIPVREIATPADPRGGHGREGAA